MFVDAIEHVASFVRPLHFISRTYGSQTVVPGSATLFFVNRDGWALTCGHVADHIISAEQLNARFADFRAELAAAPASARRKLEQKYNLSPGVVSQIKTRFIACSPGAFQLEIRRHPVHDVALLHFTPAIVPAILPRFGTGDDQPRQGRFLCRLGFPFPEFTNFAYDAVTDDIDWTASGIEHTPRFPIEGMLTRHVGDGRSIVGFELSTPGLRGQSGGPAFDRDGTIWGMQSQTRHLDLDFDVDQEVLRGGRMVKRQDSAFLHVGICVHADVLRAFMRECGVAFEEA